MDNFEFYIETPSGHIKYAKGKPAVVDREFHDYNEIVLFLEGNAQLISKDIQLNLTPNTIIFIPKENFHQFIVSDSNSYTRCILGFNTNTETEEEETQQIMKQVSVIPNPSKATLSIFEMLTSYCSKNISQKEWKLLIESCATLLLIEQRLFSNEKIEENLNLSSVTREAINFIDENFASDLSLETIAKEINTSVSTLSHCFADDLNISVYRYITQKRLSAVRQMVSSGATLNECAEKCGFKDYSSFFRVYKKYYGTLPSHISKV